MENKGEILIYQNEKGDTKVDVFLDGDTVWLSRGGIASLYQTTPQNITMHIQHIYEEGELEEISTGKNYLLVQEEGGREIARNTKFYSLDMILAVGYRVRSNIGIAFRKWASSVLTEYMKKGFALDDNRLKNPKNFGADYFKELLERIRDIRASEKRFYMQVRDLYSLSADYNGNLQATKDFFANSQNMLLFAVTGKTAAEIINERADAEKQNMGLTNFEGAIVRKKDVDIAKNYLNQDELTDLNRLVTMFLDHAEDMANQQMVMYMADWDTTITEFLTFRRRALLKGHGKISKTDAEQRALAEYAKYYRKITVYNEDEDELPKIKNRSCYKK